MKFNYGAEYKHVRIRPLETGDIEKIREWRNDSNNTEFLRNIGQITPEMQKAWFANELKDLTSCTFAIDEIGELNRMVGSVSIYDIHENVAEIGKILVGDPEAKGKKIGFYGLILAMHIGYQKLGIAKYLGEVHENNMSAKINDLRAGFIVIGEHPYPTGGVELDMELPKEHFYETHNFTNDFVIQNYKMQDFYVGKTGRFSKTLTESDVYTYAGISGDFNPVHVNSEVAKHSMFGKQICHGMLSASLISTVIGTIMPGEGTIYLGQNLKFCKPVYFGDTITAEVTVSKIIEEKNLLELSTLEMNQDGEIVIEGDALVKVQ